MPVNGSFAPKAALRAATARGNVSSTTTIFFWLNDTSRTQQMVRPDAGSRARELFDRRQGRRMFETARQACLRVAEAVMTAFFSAPRHSSAAGCGLPHF